MKLIVLKTALVFTMLALVARAEAGLSKKAADLDDIQLDDDTPSATAKPARTSARASATASAKPTAVRAPAQQAAAPLDEDLGVSSQGETTAKVVQAPEGESKEMQLLLGAADMLEKQKDFAGVAAKLKSKIDQLPRKGLLQLGRAQRALNNSLGEIQALSLVTAKSPKDYVALTLLGDAYLKARRFEDAIGTYDAAVAVNKLYRPAYEGRWSYYETTKETYEARILVQDMIKLFGLDAKTASALCRLSNAGDLLEKSEEACRTAISKDPANPDNYVFLATNLSDLEKEDAADKEIVDAAKRFPASEAVQAKAGDIKAAHKSYAEAYRYYGQAAKFNPFSAKANLGLAKSAFELQKHDEAISAFVRACKIDHRSTLDFRQAAIQLKRSGDSKWTKYQTAIDDGCEN